LSLGQVAHRAEDDHRTWIGAVARGTDAAELDARSWRDDGAGAHDFVTAWPPNSLRRAAITLPLNVSGCRDRKRIRSESVITGAGVSESMASCTVQRPSPESAT